MSREIKQTTILVDIESGFAVYAGRIACVNEFVEWANKEDGKTRFILVEQRETGANAEKANEIHSRWQEFASKNKEVLIRGAIQEAITYCGFSVTLTRNGTPVFGQMRDFYSRVQYATGDTISPIEIAEAIQAYLTEKFGEDLVNRLEFVTTHAFDKVAYTFVPRDELTAKHPHVRLVEDYPNLKISRMPHAHLLQMCRKYDAFEGNATLNRTRPVMLDALAAAHEHGKKLIVEAVDAKEKSPARKARQKGRLTKTLRK